MNLIAYVDGSFNAKTGVYGAGAVVFPEGMEDAMIKVHQSGNIKEFAASRNVAGEVLAVVMVVAGVQTMEGVDKLTIYYDYAGIKCWVTGDWRCYAPISVYYKQRMDEFKTPVVFQKVKAHSGVTYNEMADALAKKACGL